MNQPALFQAGSMRSGLRWRLPLLVVAMWAMAVVLVDPLRDFNPQDDGWAYARSVRHLVEHGEYRLDAWSAANMPVQIWVGAALSKAFGYSLTLLRLTTLAMLAVGVASFHALLRELDVERRVASLLTVALMANPLVLMLAFTFMSDIHFLGWFLAALWLYVRALRHAQGRTYLLASIVAACAIGTRQFGIALLPAAALAWACCDRRTRLPATWVLPALAIPLAMTAWQWHAGWDAPNATQAVRLDAQASYVAHSLRDLAREVVWRVATLGRYLGLLTVAAVPLVLVLAAQAWKGRGSKAAAPGIAIVAFLAYGAGKHSAITARNATDLDLPLWWMLPNAYWAYPGFLHLLDTTGLVVGAIVAWQLAGTSRRGRIDLAAAPGTTFLAAAGLGLLALHLAYVQLNDTYVITFLPFVLILIGVSTRGRRLPAWALAASAVVSIGIVAAQSLWLRGEYNLEQAQWRAADELLAAGVAEPCIAGTRHWTEYQGAFDEWLAQRPEGRIAGNAKTGEDPLHDPFYAWLAARAERADYIVVTPYDISASPWPVVDRVAYRDAWGRPGTVDIRARPGATPSTPGPACSTPSPAGPPEKRLPP